MYIAFVLNDVVGVLNQRDTGSVRLNRVHWKGGLPSVHIVKVDSCFISGVANVVAFYDGQK